MAAHKYHKFGLKGLLFVLLLILMFTMIFKNVTRHQGKSQKEVKVGKNMDRWQESFMKQIRQEIEITPIIENMERVQISWQRTKKAEKGLVILLHGCSHDGTHWFSLPEERRIVRVLLHHGLSVIAFTSQDTNSGCWDGSSIGQSNRDIQRVTPTLQKFCEREYSEYYTQETLSMCPPLFSIGASSGGSFSSILSRALPIVANIVQISTGDYKALLTEPKSLKPQRVSSFDPKILESEENIYPVPPTAFLYMVNDHNWASESVIGHVVQKIIASANKLGPNLHRQNAVIMFEAAMLPITKMWLKDRVDNVSKETSEQFYHECVTEGFIDGDGLLKEDPRSSTASRVLLRNAIYEKEISRGALEEQLNVAYAHHELTSEHIYQITTWMLEMLESKP
ncbi:1 TM domain-containing transmembrane protein [Acrasis kona]|uniref:1 TM domain-containing transmembrane protein n=1 Tax=Acrasis kona TaxID=1008807 RepID=A0AAW2ZDM9_9EUKA